MDLGHCAAIDLGAGSGRVVVAIKNGDHLSLRELSRFETPLARDPATGYQCWDLDAIEAHVRAGLEAAAALAPIRSVGIDTWGVDYVLLDAEKRRIGPAVSYRDRRTEGMIEEVAARIPAATIYQRTGIQFQPFNTLYQLAATAKRHPEWLERTCHFLMVPDYFHFRLCGVMANEYTNATTTQFFGIATNDWDDDLLAVAGLPRSAVMKPVEPGTVLDEMTVPGAGSRRIHVVAPATHDTASAVAAIPLQNGNEAFISSGTWSLMGLESRVPLMDFAKLPNCFSNEGGVDRRYRVLKNIVGLWLAQRTCSEIGNLGVSALIEAASRAVPWRSIIDPGDIRFLNPPSMVTAIRDFCTETGQPAPESPGELGRCIFESLALAYRRVKEEMEALQGRPLTRIHIVGGGCQNRLLDQLCADACQLPVSAGPVETSVLGNACIQLMALEILHSLDEARTLIRKSFAIQEYLPRDAVPAAIWDRFQGFARQRAEHNSERQTA